MKNTVSFLMALVCMISLIPLRADASETREVIYLEDGSYYIITIEESGLHRSGTKTGSKSKSYYGSDGTLKWTAYLNGTFTYNGSTSSCTESSCSISINNSAWYLISQNATKSGSTARCTITMGRRMLGITVATESVSLSLTCDKDGNLS